MQTKPNCLKCNRPYLGGRDGLCENCRKDISPRKKLKRLHCLCGKVAVAVLLADVLTPQEETMVVEVPLCNECIALELDLEMADARKPAQKQVNTIQIVIVKNLPRQKRPLRGRKF